MADPEILEGGLQVKVIAQEVREKKKKKKGGHAHFCTATPTFRAKKAS